ncbi:MAG: RDD family protein [Bdellovibrionales bacterium]|nr:RDD family protein [Ramlibacter sp.]
MNMDGADYVGFWPRALAALVDLALQAALSMPLLYLVYGRVSAPGSGIAVDGDLPHLLQALSPTQLFMGWGDFFISVVLPAIIIIAFWHKLRATPGKMLISAVVVDAVTGEPLSTRQSTLRFLGYYVSAVALGLGYLWVAFDPRKQGWHDKMAGSVVVRRRR